MPSLRKKASTAEGFAALTDEEKVALIIDVLEEEKADRAQYVIENGKVYWAYGDHEGAPKLTAQPIAEFLAENNDILQGYIEDH